MAKIRMHRGSLADSMKTLSEVADKAELLVVIKGALGDDLVGSFGIDDIDVKPYGGGRSIEALGRAVPDHRIGWQDTWAVMIRGYIDAPTEWSVWGFADGPVPLSAA